MRTADRRRGVADVLRLFAPAGIAGKRVVVKPNFNSADEAPVSTCCLKTHGYGGVFTMSLELSVELTPKTIRRTMHGSPEMRRMIASDDRVAVDAVGLAVLKDLGASGPADIELLAAADAESRALAGRLERILAEG